MMYQELYAKVYEKSYNAIVDMIMDLYSTCKENDAWISDNVEQFQNCTKQIIASRSVIQENIKTIESFSINFNGTMISPGLFSPSYSDYVSSRL